MRDPVVLSDGHTYERVAAERWLLRHDTSPMTGSPLVTKALTPNLLVRAMITDWHAGAAFPTQAPSISARARKHGAAQA